MDDTSFQAMKMAELIELSSLGSPAARRLRSETPRAVKQQVLARLLRHAGRDSRPHVSTDPGAVAPYFFVSHARGATVPARDGVAVHRFFRLMCSYVHQLAADVASDEESPATWVPGHLPGGTSWGALGRTRTAEALATCRVLVPVVSTAFFESAACRREIEAFTARDDARQQAHPFGFSAIVPVLWTGEAHIDVPAWGERFFEADATLGDQYVRFGLRGLMDRNDLLYRKVVFRIARRVRDVAECL